MVWLFWLCACWISRDLRFRILDLGVSRIFGLWKSNVWFSDWDFGRQKDLKISVGKKSPLQAMKSMVEKQSDGELNTLITQISKFEPVEAQGIEQDDSEWPPKNWGKDIRKKSWFRNCLSLWLLQLFLFFEPIFGWRFFGWRFLVEFAEPMSGTNA